MDTEYHIATLVFALYWNRSMTNLTRFMAELAALMRQNSLGRVEDLLANPELLASFGPTEAGLDLLKDLRKFTARGLESEASEIDRDLLEQARATARVRTDPPRRDRATIQRNLEELKEQAQPLRK